MFAAQFRLLFYNSEVRYDCHVFAAAVVGAKGKKNRSSGKVNKRDLKTNENEWVIILFFSIIAEISDRVTWDFLFFFFLKSIAI